MSSQALLRAPLVLIHVGAGKHSDRSDFKKPLQRACKKGIRGLLDQGHQQKSIFHGSGGQVEIERKLIDTLCTVSQLVENLPRTNVSVGSSLSYLGKVKNDALVAYNRDTSVTLGLTGISRYKHPITRCINYLLLKELDSGSSIVGVTKPILLVDLGEDHFSRQADLHDDGCCGEEELISSNAKALYSYWSSIRDQRLKDPLPIDEITDTIGVLLMSQDGSKLAGCLSGGNTLKNDGRIGCASIYGAGYYSLKSSELLIYSYLCEKGMVQAHYDISLFASGNGEQILSSSLARECCEAILLRLHMDPEASIYDSSQILALILTSYAGVVGVISDHVSRFLIYAHKTEDFIFAVSLGEQPEYQYFFSRKAKQYSETKHLAPLYGQMRVAS